jgi:hypothetical protein
LSSFCADCYGGIYFYQLSADVKFTELKKITADKTQQRINPMKLIFVYIVSWLVGLFSSLLVSYFYYDEPFSVADLFGFATLSFVPALLVCALLYTPGLFYLKRKLKECKAPLLFPVVSTFVLNAPAVLIILWQTGRTMRSSEAVSFAVIFLVMGLFSGIGFVWSYGDASKQ